MYRCRFSTRYLLTRFGIRVCMINSGWSETSLSVGHELTGQKWNLSAFAQTRFNAASATWRRLFLRLRVTQCDLLFWLMENWQRTQLTVSRCSPPTKAARLTAQTVCGGRLLNVHSTWPERRWLLVARISTITTLQNLFEVLVFFYWAVFDDVLSQNAANSVSTHRVFFL